MGSLAGSSCIAVKSLRVTRTGTVRAPLGMREPYDTLAATFDAAVRPSCATLLAQFLHDRGVEHRGHALRHHASRRHPARGHVALGRGQAAHRGASSTCSASTTSRAASRARNPKDIEFFERARDLKLEQAVISAFGSTRRKDTPRRGRPGPRGAARHGLLGAVHLRQVVGRARHRDAADHARGERAHGARLGAPTSRRRAARSSSTPSTSSTATRPTPTTRVEVVPGRRRGGRRRDRAVRHQRRHAAARGRCASSAR